MDVIHFPATFLDAVRTFHRVQVEIKNLGNKPIKYKDIHFRIRIYKNETDNDNV